jgi:ATP-dependent Clp protease ATP-binding subunit ClpC
MPELTVAADLAWRIAALEAQRGRATAVSLDHLLVGLLSLDKLLVPSAGLSHNKHEAVQAEQTTLVRVLHGLGLDPATARRAVRAGIPPGRSTSPDVLKRDPACRAAFARAEALAGARGEAACGVLHLLAAVLERPAPSLAAALGDLDRLRAGVEIALAPAPPPLPDPGPGDSAGLTSVTAQPTACSAPPLTVSAQPPATMAPPPAPRVPPLLLRYGRDLTTEAEAGRLPPVIGRQDELLQVVRVLHRRTKNNPVLIGEAGVGKTAVVEGLAQRIVEGSVLPGRRILALSITSVVAGTTYRGQFEERLEEILAALRSHPDIILFLDELHTIVGAGGADGRLDAAGILKPALARGEIACIGATTVDEYRRHIESDPALERRFQPILVSEPSRADTLTILEGLRPELERHHGVRIEAEALRAAVELTVDHVAARRLPDKAVDALDEACARASVPGLADDRRATTGPAELAPVVTRETVAAVVSGWAGVPLGQTASDAMGRLSDLEGRLAARIVGQPEAIRAVAERIRLARTGLSDAARPAAVLLLVGPRGVGKTELAVALAESLADGPSDQPALIRLSMSEYAERQTAAHLLGSTGSAGREQEGRLTGPLRRSPRSVVLLDEIEQAHADVLGALLPLLQRGRLTDAHGHRVDGRQAIVVLTATATIGESGRRSLGFGGAASASEPDTDAVLREIRSTLGPDLPGCVDAVVLLRPLGEDALLEIARRRVAALQTRVLAHHNLDITVSDDALAMLARRALAGHGGAHELDRVITRLLAEPLSRELHAGRIQPGARLLSARSGDAITFQTSNA